MLNEKKTTRALTRMRLYTQILHTHVPINQSVSVSIHIAAKKFSFINHFVDDIFQFDAYFSIEMDKIKTKRDEFLV